MSQFSYLPGLDGLRAIAVVAVMVYHADREWLPGGFLGVEVFFVISGYLITLLLIAEHERSRSIKLGAFWMRRARRLLPALFLMMALLVVYTALFERDTLGLLRGDVLAGTFYGSNWFQVWIGAGYTAAADFAPLRHLWSLAVEEQFYLLWPLIMVLLLRVKGRRIAEASRWLVLVAVAITVATALLYHEGRIGTVTQTPEAYWMIGDRAVSKADGLYLNTISRSTGLLLGAALAMVWRPRALARGPIREKGPLVDLIGLVGLLVLGMLAWSLHIVTLEGADPWLYRGGLFATGVATLLLIAAASHPHAVSGTLLGNPLLRWIGTRSYGLYLFHWPIYRIIQLRAGDITTMTLAQFALAMAITVVITEASYRLVEMPIRTGAMRRWWSQIRVQRDATARRAVVFGGAACVGFVAFAGVNLATAELKQNEIAQSLDDARDDIVDLGIPTPGSDGGSGGPPTDESSTPSTRRPSESQASIAIPPIPPPPGTEPPVTLPPEASPPVVPPPTTAPLVTQPPPPTTQPPLPTTVQPPPTLVTQPPPSGAFNRLAIGDSVMFGAAEALGEYGIDVEAEESRSFDDGIEIFEMLDRQGRLGNVVVIQLGVNQANTEEEDFDRLMSSLVDVPQVLFITNRYDKAYVDQQNAWIRALPARYPNVLVMDWASIGDECVGECYYNDGLHLAPDGRQLYADHVAIALGIN